jgi:hypothetical protein
MDIVGFLPLSPFLQKMEMRLITAMIAAIAPIITFKPSFIEKI